MLFLTLVASFSKDEPHELCKEYICEFFFEFAVCSCCIN